MSLVPIFLSPSHNKCHKISITNQNAASIPLEKITFYLLLLWLIFSLVFLKTEAKMNHHKIVTPAIISSVENMAVLL
jgi:hypothetical protein